MSINSLAPSNGLCDVNYVYSCFVFQEKLFSYCEFWKMFEQKLFSLTCIPEPCFTKYYTTNYKNYLIVSISFDFFSNTSGCPIHKTINFLSRYLSVKNLAVLFFASQQYCLYHQFKYSIALKSHEFVDLIIIVSLE